MKQRHPPPKVTSIYVPPPPRRIEVYWYRWEFLRRNPEYRADYQEFTKRFGAWLNLKGYWYEDDPRKSWTKLDEKYFRSKILPYLLALSGKWRLSTLVPPKWQFDLKTGMCTTGPDTLEIPTMVAPGWEWEDTIEEIMQLGFTGTTDTAKRYQSVLLAEFDLRWPTKDLLDYASRLFAYARKNYESELRQKGVAIPHERRQLQNYGDNLRIWDLKQEGKDIEEIAELVFPRDHRDSALQKVRDRLRAAQRLISGHPQEIR
jgi:hypothetical protein